MITFQKGIWFLCNGLQGFKPLFIFHIFMKVNSFLYFLCTASPCPIPDKEGQSHITTKSQSASQSWCQATSEVQDHIFVTVRQYSGGLRTGRPGSIPGKSKRFSSTLQRPGQLCSPNSASHLIGTGGKAAEARS